LNRRKFPIAINHYYPFFLYLKNEEQLQFKYFSTVYNIQNELFYLLALVVVSSSSSPCSSPLPSFLLFFFNKIILL